MLWVWEIVRIARECSIAGAVGGISDPLGGLLALAGCGGRGIRARSGCGAVVGKWCVSSVAFLRSGEVFCCFSTIHSIHRIYHACQHCIQRKYNLLEYLYIRCTSLLQLNGHTVYIEKQSVYSDCGCHRCDREGNHQKNRDRSRKNDRVEQEDSRYHASVASSAAVYSCLGVQAYEARLGVRA